LLVDAPVLIELGQSYVLHRDDFLCLKMTSESLHNLASPSNFVITPFGKADLLIIETFKPESKSTQKSLQILMGPIVSVAQMVTGDSCLGISIFGP
jgi:hypothetical protein